MPDDNKAPSHPPQPWTATDPAPVRRQATRPDAYGIREAPEAPICEKCHVAMVPHQDIGGEHLGWRCKDCRRESPPAG
ncbi:MAG TPA: hypothetical protein VN894_12660 [Polyangiaceae bacterium]|nr:hypothetical protein [Polyangiaceae bacterium]